MTDSAPGSSLDQGGLTRRGGTEPSGSPSPPTGTGADVSARQLDPSTREHGDLRQRDVLAVVDLRQRRISETLEAASMTTTSSSPSSTPASGAIFMPLP